MLPAMAIVKTPTRTSAADPGLIRLCILSVLVAAAAALIAKGLMSLIGLITNFSFYHIWSTQLTPPAGAAAHLGWTIILIPVAAGLIIGLMARYGSAGIRGDGIPEAVEKVLAHQSRIPPIMTFLKPLSAAICIGAGGPFGAEGPIIATGGALGSWIGQIVPTSTWERKTLLSAGAAAGFATTFGCPVAAVLMAIELLLFEFRTRSLVPVCLAAFVAAGLRFLLNMRYPIFPMPDLAQPGAPALLSYILIGGVVGWASIYVSRAVYWVEDAFDRLPIHWMWWPAIGSVAVGVIGYVQPHTLGVGYDIIGDFLAGRMVLGAVAAIAFLKFISWAIALGSGTSGGTLAPLFTFGAGLGLILGYAAAHLLPSWGIDPRVGALVGMAAMFAGSTRALLTSAVFAFETTLQPVGLLPLLGGCAAAYLVSALLMRHTIVMEKIARHGVRVPDDVTGDYMDSLLVRDVATANPVTLQGDKTLGEVRQWMNAATPEAEHQGYPIVDERGFCLGVLTRRDLLSHGHDPAAKLAELIRRPPVVVYADCTLRDAADHMVHHGIGRLPVVDRKQGGKLVGIVTRGDLLKSSAAQSGRENDGTRSVPLRAASFRT
jgi:chloride channel protein, CIC family